MTAVKLKWALGASVVLNLFLIAAGIGAAVVVHHRMHDFRHPAPSSTVWSNTAKDLSPESRARILAVVKAAALSGEGDMDKARGLRSQAAAAAATDPYNADKVSELSAQARVLEGNARNTVEEALIHGMAPLAARERAAIANRLLRPGFRFRRMLGKDGGHDKGEQKADQNGDGPNSDGPGASGN